MARPTLRKHIKELKKRKPPLIVVNAVIQKDDEVLLIQRSKEPAKGSWVVPGGHVKYNEELEEAVIREVKEETGLEVNIVGIISTKTDKEGIDPRGFHLAVNFLTTPVKGRIQKTKEAKDIKWFKLGKLPKNLGLGCKEYFQETITPEQQISELIKYIPPMPMVNQVICKDNKILLGKRNKPPYFSEWGLPGGHFSFKETIEKASIRKAKEETGLDIKIEFVLDTWSDFGIDPRSKNLIITHLCRFKSGKLRPSEDFSKFFWYDVRKPLPKRIKIINPGYVRAIEKAKNYLLSKLKGGK